MTAKEMREERAKTAVEIRQLADKANNEKRDFTAEEKPHWEAVNKKYDEQTRQIEIAERAEKVDAEQRGNDDGDKGRKPGRDDVDTKKAIDDANRRDDGDGDELTDEELGLNERSVKPEVFGLALRGWMLRASGQPTEERHEKAARLCGINLRGRHLDINLNRRAMTPREARAMSSVDTAAGAATIASAGFAGSFESAMITFGGMRNVAQTIRTETGAEMPWPTVNDASNEGEIVGENTVPGKQDPTTGAIRWFAHKYSSKIIQVPIELLEDSAFDLASEIGRMCGERIARRQNKDFTTGDGASKPRGLLTAATLGVTAAGAAAITADELLNLIHSVDPAYRLNARFMLSDSSLLVIRKLKDSQGRYLFQDAIAGSVSTIFGVPYEINQHMPTIAASAKSVVYGQLDKYKVRDVRAIRFRRLVERYADSDQEGFVAFMRSDGNLLDAGAGPVRYLQQAA